MTENPEQPAQPKGELAIRTVPLPGDTNAAGDIFGGWVLSQMDIAGGIAAYERARGRVVTVAIEAMTFLAPVKTGDVVSVYCSITRVGTTSITVDIETWVRRYLDDKVVKVTEGNFIYVVLDENGKPRPVDP